MKIIKNINEIEKTNAQLVYATIGNFDGVHSGHRSFLKQVKKDCDDDGAKFLIVTFIPHPLQILKAQKGFLINTYQEKAELLSDVGVDYLLEIDFTRDFSTLSPEEFLKNYILVSSQVKKIFLGHDFVFGANKSGDFNVAKKICEQSKIELKLQSEYKYLGDSVSSTIVRGEIANGNMEKVNELLDRKYFISGRVIKGEGRGKKIGFPTANLGYDQGLIIPSKGVYVTQVIINNMIYCSVTNVGINPTFSSGYDVHIETHLLNFTQDIYGETIKVLFMKKIRDEKKFPSVNDLIFQINEDVEETKSFFNL